MKNLKHQKMANNIDKNIFSTQYPTFPVQDKFNQVLVQFGASKIEAATVQIAAALVSHPTCYDGKILPEVIAEEAYNIALACFEKVNDEFVKASAVAAAPSLLVSK